MCACVRASACVCVCAHASACVCVCTFVLCLGVSLCACSHHRPTPDELSRSILLLAAPAHAFMRLPLLLCVPLPRPALTCLPHLPAPAPAPDINIPGLMPGQIATPVRLGRARQGIFSPMLPELAGLDAERIVQVCAGRHTSAALTAAGEVWAWGGGFNGELGSASLSLAPGPRRVDGILAEASSAPAPRATALVSASWLGREAGAPDCAPDCAVLGVLPACACRTGAHRVRAIHAGPALACL